MRKRTLYIGVLTLTAATFLVACSPGSATDQTSIDNTKPAIDDNNDVDNSETPVRVYANLQNLFFISATAASQENDIPEDTERINQKFKNTHFYILAFRNKAWTSQSVNSSYNA